MALADGTMVANWQNWNSVLYEYHKLSFASRARGMPAAAEGVVSRRINAFAPNKTKRRALRECNRQLVPVVITGLSPNASSKDFAAPNLRTSPSYGGNAPPNPSTRLALATSSSCPSDQSGETKQFF
jgi:hypothetical protein